MQLNSLKKISKILNDELFSAAQAHALGVHPSLLAYYRKKGVLERVSRGFYRIANAETKTPPEWQDVALIASSVPQGVLCLITALVYYEMTDEFAREIWIAVPRHTRPPKRTNTRVVRFSNMTLGVQTIRLGDTPVKIFDRERTVIDSFRYLSKEIAIKALKKYLKQSDTHKPDLKKLNRYAKILRTDIRAYTDAILT